MPNDSTALGYLQPASPPPDYDQALEDTFHDLCAGVTGIDPTLVRPRWQTWPGNIPDQESLWVSFGLSIAKREWDPIITHDPNDASGTGSSTVNRNETIECNFSFYGLTGQQYATMFADGMALSQNRDVLSGKGFKFVEFADPVSVPALVKNVWARRIDLKGTFTRTASRTYSVRNLLSANINIDNERYVTVINTP